MSKEIDMATADDNTAGARPERLLAFSDGMFSIIITIMVLELKIPHAPTPEALLEEWPKFLVYALSFLQAGIYWVNHHALYNGVEKINSRILWLNLLLLFFLSLIPFATGYAGETDFATFPTALYALVMLLPAVTWNWLHGAIVRINPSEAGVTRAALTKGYLALALYVSAVGLAFVSPALSLLLILTVAVMYFLPSRYF
jgi:uncharacterized membrane protein